MKQSDGSGAGMLGLGAVACLACCAGPVLAFLGGLGVAGLASAVFIGGVGLAVTAAAIAAFVVVDRGRSSCPVPDERPVAVAAPTRRAPQP
jgi:hypothetical protein